MPRDVTRRLTLLTTIAVLTVGALAGLGVRELSRWDELAAQLARESLEASLDGVFHSALTRATGEAVSFAATGNQEYAREATDALLYAQSAMTQLRRIGADRAPSDHGAEIRKLREAQEELLSRVRRSVTQSLRSRPTSEAMAQERLEQIYEPESDSDRIWLSIVAWHDTERRVLNRTLRSQRQRVLAIVGATVLASLLWAVLMHTLVVRDLVAPLRRLAQHARELADSEPEPAAAGVPAEGDLGVLQEALGRIARHLRPTTSGITPEFKDSERSRPSTATGPDEASNPDAPTHDGPKRALLIAVDPAERDLTRAMLQHYGLTVTTPEEGAEAEAVLDGGRIDLVVVDPGAVGSPATDALMRHRAGPPVRRRLPVILLSPEDAQAELPDWFLEGLDTRLNRPFSFFDLHAAITRILGAT